MTDMPTRQEIAEVIEKILSRREFGGSGELLPQTKDLTEPVAETVWNATDFFGEFGMLAVIMMGIALFVLVLWMVGTESRYRLEGVPRRRSGRSVSPNDPLADAEALAAQGDWEGALVTLFALHLQILHRQGWIVVEKSKTTLQYQWELMGKGYDDVEGFASFRGVFNRVRYGGYPELRETYEHWLSYCRSREEGRRAA